MDKIHEFLQIGYLATENTEYKLDYTFNEEVKGMSNKDLINLLKERLLKHIEREVNSASAVLVPISGGLDSRLLLMALMECYESSRIKTLTFGINGSLDFEIGNKIAKKINSDHFSIDFMKYQFKYDDLDIFVNNIEKPVPLFHNIPSSFVNEIGNIKVLSGFLGDAVSGKHSMGGTKPELTTEMKKEYFYELTKRNNFGVYNKDIIDKMASDVYVEQIYNLDPVEWINIMETNLKMDINQVLGAFKKENIITPFYNTELMNLLISLPPEMRKNQKLYKKLIFENFNNDLTKFPVKNFNGSTYYDGRLKTNINRVKNGLLHQISKKSNFTNSPYSNYMNFEKKIKKDNNFRELLIKLHESLKDRNLKKYNETIERSLNDLNSNHIKNGYDYLMLASLEMFISKGKFNA